MQMSVHITGLDESKVKLDALKTGLVTGMQPALEEVGELGSKYFGGVAFQSKGSAFGQPWAPLAASTVSEKDKAGYRGYPDMVRTSEMLNSFSFEMTEPGVVRLYNKAPYFKYHQSADDREKLPRRVMIGVNATLEAIVQTAIRKRVILIINEAIKA
jgi:hypothetical protein